MEKMNAKMTEEDAVIALMTHNGLSPLQAKEYIRLTKEGLDITIDDIKLLSKI